VGVDDGRVDLLQGLVVQAHALHDAASEIVEHNVGLANKLEEDLLAPGMLQVDDQGPLAAVVGLEVRADGEPAVKEEPAGRVR
jgi:hypothetical protein